MDEQRNVGSVRKLRCALTFVVGGGGVDAGVCGLTEDGGCWEAGGCWAAGAGAFGGSAAGLAAGTATGTAAGLTAGLAAGLAAVVVAAGFAVVVG